MARYKQYTLNNAPDDLPQPGDPEYIAMEQAINGTKYVDASKGMMQEPQDNPEGMQSPIPITEDMSGMDIMKAIANAPPQKDRMFAGSIGTTDPQAAQYGQNNSFMQEFANKFPVLSGVLFDKQPDSKYDTTFKAADSTKIGNMQGTGMEPQMGPPPPPPTPPPTNMPTDKDAAAKKAINLAANSGALPRTNLAQDFGPPKPGPQVAPLPPPKDGGLGGYGSFGAMGPYMKQQNVLQLRPQMNPLDLLKFPPPPGGL